jgi:hypothetical protein
MYPKYHIIFGAIITLIIYLIIPITLLQATIIFFSSVLIDFDHYLLYILKKKNLSLKKAIKLFVNDREKFLKLKEKSKFKYHIIIFHGVEFWIILLILAQFYSVIYYVLIGILIHMVFDLIEVIYLKMPIYTKISQILVYLRNKK